jgi:hypothetical protein
MSFETFIKEMGMDDDRLRDCIIVVKQFSGVFAEFAELRQS